MEVNYEKNIIMFMFCISYDKSSTGKRTVLLWLWNG